MKQIIACPRKSALHLFLCQKLAPEPTTKLSEFVPIFGRKSPSPSPSKTSTGSGACMDVGNKHSSAGGSMLSEFESIENYVAPPPPVMSPGTTAGTSLSFVVEHPNAPPRFLSSRVAEFLTQNSLPPMLRFAKWKRVFSLLRDGSSFLTAMNNCRAEKATIIAVETTAGEIFGCFANNKWEAPQGALRFFGSGECFVFRATESKIILPAEVYKWTGQNSLFQLLENETGKLAMGGGGADGAFAFCLEDDFQRGTTGSTATFDNPPLTESGAFEVMNVEIYGFVNEFDDF